MKLIHSVVAAFFWLMPVYAIAQDNSTNEIRATLQGTPLEIQNGKAQLLGRYDPDGELHIVIGLHPPHMQEEEEFLSHPGHYLTPEQWNARFAPTAEAEGAVVNWVQSQGLTVTKRFPNRLIIDVSGRSADMEKAFHVIINRYQIEGIMSPSLITRYPLQPRQNTDEVYYSNDRDPSIPMWLSPLIQSVEGLNNILRAQHASQ